MKNFMVRFVACFIPNKDARHAFRNKHQSKTIKDRIRDIDRKINSLNDIINGMRDNILNTDRFDILNNNINGSHDIVQMGINQQNTILGEVQYIKNFLVNTTDITNVPRAHGIMRQVQMLNLKVLTEVDKICRKHNLSYWLDFGTLLGAVRHGGFIPWDDDIDIGMPSADYEKFCKIADKELDGTCALFKRVPSQIGKTLHRDFVPQTPSEWVDFIFWRLRGKLAFATDIFPYYFSDTDKETIAKTLQQGNDLKSELFNDFNEYDEFKTVEAKTLSLQKNYNQTTVNIFS